MQRAWFASTMLVAGLGLAACGDDAEGGGSGGSGGAASTGGATGGTTGGGGASTGGNGGTTGGGGAPGGGGGTTGGGGAGTGGGGGTTGGGGAPGGGGASAGGKSLRFFATGQNDVDRVKIKLDAPAVPADVGQADFTLELWLKVAVSENHAGGCVAGGDGWINGNIILDRDVYGAGDYGDFGLSLFSNGLAIGVSKGNSGTTLCGSAGVHDGQWHHVAVTRASATGQIRLWVDGKADGQITGPAGDVSYKNGRATSYPNSDPFLVIGAEKHDAGPAYPSFAGWVDELRLSTNVRYDAPFSPPKATHAPDAHTAALYHFDEGSGTTLGDSSGASGGPSNGLLKVGGPKNGPAWTSDVPF